MFALITAIFLASILGSFHCAGMCGAFLAVASGGLDKGAARQTILQGAYHLGRLVTYVALGAAAGTVGRLLNLAGMMAGIRPIAAMLAGTTMVAFALITLLRARGMSIRHLGVPKSWTRLMHVGYRAAMDRPPMLRAAMIGLLTTMLPCGWLYAFAMTAAGTGSGPRGALAMAAFWAGTLPMLVGLGAGIRGVLGPVGRALPTLTVVAMLVAGLSTLNARASLDPTALVGRLQSTLTSRVPGSESSPCCTTHDTHR